MPQHLDPYLKQFGLKPGANFQQITARYFACLEEFPHHLTPEQKAEKESVDHAYEILKRAYKTDKPKAPPLRKVSRRSQAAARRTALTTGLLVALLVGAAVLLAINYSEIKLKVSNYHAGDVVRWENSSDTYGKIMQFNPSHSFGTGNASPAYEIQLEGTTETVWISERVVEKAMVRVKTD
jgi:hypothetical protein